MGQSHPTSLENPYIKAYSIVGNDQSKDFFLIANATVSDEALLCRRVLCSYRAVWRRVCSFI
ncbi:MAG: hypothetical protein JST69_03395 [Bacteroidetes bacterium]|nr:hypothetical protein [Bacteroidota bacterium]